MPANSATAIAHPNIAFIKYWGDVDTHLHIPVSGSISMNLEELTTRTTVTFDAALVDDHFFLDGELQTGEPVHRVHSFLDRVRTLAGMSVFAAVESHSNFPVGAGIASSASGFAALALAASTAVGLNLDERVLSRLARTGSGSACRSIPAGFVEWQAGTGDSDSYAYSIAPPGHWDLADCIAVVSQEHKLISSASGHSIAHTSPLQAARIAGAPQRLDHCRDAILHRDFDTLVDVVELDSNLMHAVMLTSIPPLLYWQPATLQVMQAVVAMRMDHLPACFTIDAGPNVHVICPRESTADVANRLRSIPGVQDVLIAHPGGGASLFSGRF